MRLHRLSIVFIFLCLSFNSLASSSLESVFRESFFSDYKKGRCGDNILSLIKKAHELEINLEGARILEIVNKGNSVMGLVNAEFAREGGRVDPSSSNIKPYRYLAGEKNWYHHVVLEFEGFIYDFDFGNLPRVLSVKDYFEMMFLSEKHESEGGSFYVGREDKLLEYEVTIKDALSTFRARIQKKESPVGQKMSFDNFLQKF